MNNCQSVKDLILTDYIDGEADKETMVRIESHLQVCLDCQRFRQEAERNLAVPFKELGRETVPDHLWSSIKEKIEVSGAVSPSTDFIGWLIGSLSFSRLAPVVVSCVALILIGSTVFYVQQIKQVKERDQVEYLASVFGSTGAASETENEGLGTMIEKYFL